MLVDARTNYEIFTTHPSLSLTQAVASGNVESIQAALSQQTVDINELDDDGQAAIHAATRCGMLKIVQLLCRQPKFGK